MNRIRLQDLTPDVYYKQSRDFQFIGRLYDIVLNSVKTSSENLYSLPLNENSDEQMIDLLTMTLGFKSRHNYNVKQLTSLCSAFATVLKNKGNITSIITAVQALLNAEGIADTMDYNLENDNTVLNLFIPQTLTDTNLLKDLLIYILPAGMSCNIIKEFKITTKALTEATTTDSIKCYEYEDSRKLSIVPRPGQEGLGDALAKNTMGLIMNSDVYRPDQNIYYNIKYYANGGLFDKTITIPCIYIKGTQTTLPTQITKKIGKTDYNFDGWFDNKACEGTAITEIAATATGDKVFYAKWTKQETN